MDKEPCTRTLVTTNNIIELKSRPCTSDLYVIPQTDMTIEPHAPTPNKKTQVLVSEVSEPTKGDSENLFFFLSILINFIC